MKLNGTSKVDIDGNLIIGGVSCINLVNDYSTPLFVYDEQLIRQQCRRFKETLSKSGTNFHISYASKAFICKEMVKIIKEEGMGLDVVSIGELYNALAADFPADRIHFHGNNKTEEEIVYALENNIGCFVIDSMDEVDKLEKNLRKLDKKTKCLLRVTPGIEAHTHEFITTGNTDSKFGLNIDNKQAEKAIIKILESRYLEIIGVHFHIGSQIFGVDGTIVAMEKIFKWLSELEKSILFKAKVVNIGGGFGIRYTNEDISYPIEDSLKKIINSLKSLSSKYNVQMPQLWLEPGRSIVGEAGYTLYKVGTKKEIPHVRNYVSVDGGMSDHIRTALYGAKYEVAIANKMNKNTDYLATIAGKCCESGDIIAKDVYIANPEIGDILVVSCTGAYHYSMASNYNQMTKPAVVFVENGNSKLVIKRESLHDLIRNQL
ncbi:diaminopimelate decarboxylase [Peptostreptococcus canis]|uniref:Diaminopimelate decarboxylase n=1 Tax=Peptostreptococcus canis TaxID=1159213 RepID=A0ABR6TJ19_9FIRM|nr:diaminopimelate decarboxylase [Peptostreptococcus canis]MBC2575417.1 diaminopimelate decarboxylase [Peptostreptococcus canis]MBP1997394.1 diaminopimelate decarboxylase [Peptostreptococcus canis]